MMWIGLTGSIGAGKSTVAVMLRKAGFSVIDADAIAHEGLKSGTSAYDAIVRQFGPKILNADGEIKRRELGQFIFADSSLKTWLENLLHPLVQAKVQALRKKLESDGNKIAFYEVPLLFEKGLESQFDKVVVVWVSDSVQKSRLQSRNSWSDAEIAQRNQSQWSVAEKVKRADISINNDGSIDELQNQVNELIKTLSKN